jgi:hypothetical protein
VGGVGAAIETDRGCAITKEVTDPFAERRGVSKEVEEGDHVIATYVIKEPFDI